MEEGSGLFLVTSDATDLTWRVPSAEFLIIDLGRDYRSLTQAINSPPNFHSLYIHQMVCYNQSTRLPAYLSIFSSLMMREGQHTTVLPTLTFAHDIKSGQMKFYAKNVVKPVLRDHNKNMWSNE